MITKKKFNYFKELFNFNELLYCQKLSREEILISAKYTKLAQPRNLIPQK